MAFGVHIVRDVTSSLIMIHWYAVMKRG